jgi:hypothetical protein
MCLPHEYFYKQHITFLKLGKYIMALHFIINDPIMTAVEICKMG